MASGSTDKLGEGKYCAQTKAAAGGEAHVPMVEEELEPPLPLPLAQDALLKKAKSW